MEILTETDTNSKCTSMIFKEYNISDKFDVHSVRACYEVNRGLSKLQIWMYIYKTGSGRNKIPINTYIHVHTYRHDSFPKGGVVRDYFVPHEMILTSLWVHPYSSTYSYEDHVGICSSVSGILDLSFPKRLQFCHGTSV